MTYELKTYFVYILVSKRRGVLYTGFTNDLSARTYQHKFGEIEGFTKKYFVKHLVYNETYEDPYLAIAREKQLKKWYRAWKIQLIEKHNPHWIDLFQDGEILPLPIE